MRVGFVRRRPVVVGCRRKLPNPLIFRKVPRMARFTIATAAADPVRPYLEGVAKSLVDRLYGAEGPAWGTRLTEIEDTLLAVRHVLTEEMLAEALQRQATTVNDQPAAVRCCSKCGTEVGPKDKDKEEKPRVLLTRVGEAEWVESESYCHKCRRSFFPSEQEFGHRSEHAESGTAAENHLCGHE